MSDKHDHIMQFFAYEHLPPHLQAVSKPFADLARAIVGDSADASVFAVGSATPSYVAGSDADNAQKKAGFTLPRNPERTVALRKLLEAKDAAVRAKLAVDP